MSAPFSIGTKVLGGGAALLVLFLLVGYLLPGTWAAERSIEIGAPPEGVFPLLDAPDAWRRWTQWPDTGIVAEGPARGPGSRLAWNDRELGEGSFEIVEAESPARLSYTVAVQGGSMRTTGTMRLEPIAGGVLVHWREEGDFGWNPLMGYWARAMERAQGTEMEKSLSRLKALAEVETEG
jgi:uncharacterized protein YndB with AHSA1/START domain